MMSIVLFVITAVIFWEAVYFIDINPAFMTAATCVVLSVLWFVVFKLEIGEPVALSNYAKHDLTGEASCALLILFLMLMLAAYFALVEIVSSFLILRYFFFAHNRKKHAWTIPPCPK